MRPLKNFKLVIEYDGTEFNGWQVQSQGERTVQGEIQNALFQIYKKKITVIGSGRTDARVHALGQVVNFKTRTRMSGSEVQKALMAFLPGDIVVKDVHEVDLDFHAQFSAKNKTYRYTILNRSYPSAKDRNYCHFYPYSLSIQRMRREAKSIVGKKDFKAFEASDPKRAKHSTVRHIQRIKIVKKDDWVYIDVQADGFLYKMVRNIVGTLLEAGANRLPQGGVGSIIRKKDRDLAGETAQPQGLCLVEVQY